MTSSTRAMLSATVLTAISVASPLYAQSLADVAKKADEARVKAKQEQAKSGDTKKADDTKKTDKAPTKVYTNNDLDDRPAPVVPPPVEAATATSPTAATTPASETKKTGPTAAQLHELEITQQRVALKKLQTSLHDGEDALRKARETYGNMCTTLHLQVTEPCPSLRTSIDVELPYALRDVRRGIIELAVKLGLDPAKELAQ